MEALKRTRLADQVKTVSEFWNGAVNGSWSGGGSDWSVADEEGTRNGSVKT